MLMVLCTAFGEESQESSSKNQPRTVTIWDSLKKGKTQTIIFYGTSLTCQEYVGGAGEWMMEVRKWGSERFGDRLKIINAAEGGKNSQWGLEQLEERVLKNKPDYVFIEFGMNDSYVPYACTLAQVEKQIDELTERILRSHPNLGICLMTMNPKIENAEKPVAPGRHNLLTEFYRLYQESSEKKKLDFIDHHGRWIQRERNEPGYLKKHIPDGVHPDGESAKEIVGGGVKEFLKEKLK